MYVCMYVYIYMCVYSIHLCVCVYIYIYIYIYIYTLLEFRDLIRVWASPKRKLAGALGSKLCFFGEPFGTALEETTGGEFRVHRASIRHIDLL